MPSPKRSLARALTTQTSHLIRKGYEFRSDPARRNCKTTKWGWEQRGNNSYYYKKRRDGARVKSVYVGRGEVAHFISELQSSSPLLTSLTRSLKPEWCVIIGPGGKKIHASEYLNGWGI